MSKELQFFSQNGNVVDAGAAVISIASPAVKYGMNVFEGLRGYWSEEEGDLYVFRCEAHYRRLQNSVKVIGLTMPASPAELCEHMLAMLRANGLKEDCHIRHAIYLDGDGGFSALGPTASFVTAVRRGRSFDSTTGVKAGVSSWTRIIDNAIPPRIKAGPNYLNSRMAEMETKRHGYEVAILLGPDGKVAETAGAAIFLVRDGTIITPPVTAGILESVTRDTVLHLARARFDLPVVERTVDRTELYVADEAFIAGTGAEVVPVNSVDGQPVGNGMRGPITEKIQALYTAVVRGQVPEYRHWLTSIYHNGG